MQENISQVVTPEVKLVKRKVNHIGKALDRPVKYVAVGREVGEKNLEDIGRVLNQGIFQNQRAVIPDKAHPEGIEINQEA
jgi:hypothetical protein